MLTKNVYILYPAGYGGNYLSWAIQASDVDLAKHTVTCPVNTKSSTKYGGVGTSHLHHRIPTHQSIRQHLPWMILNKPSACNIYVLNTNTDTIAETISSILGYDRDPVFIVIHDNSNLDIRSYAQINCITKWPVFFSAMSASEGIPLTFDPYTYQDNLHFRNLVATEKTIMTHMDPVDTSQLEKIKSKYLNYVLWYKARNIRNPHEVNKNYYIERDGLPESCIFQISCLDLVQKNFLEILDDILIQSQCSSNFDTKKIQDAHDMYVESQPNLQWFKSLDHWSNTGDLDPYLISHSGIQGMLISRILKKLNLIDADIDREQQTWQKFYSKIKGESWPTCNNEVEFYNLNLDIQTEIVDQFGYKPKTKNYTQARFVLKDWQTLSIQNINSVYKTSI